MENVAENKNIVRSCDVVGVSVINYENETLGKVYEIVLNKYTGQTAYVVLESGAFLGMGGKFFAIPWKAFKFVPEKNAFLVSLNKEQLKNAPGFDKDNWPKTYDDLWGAKISTYYNSL